MAILEVKDINTYYGTAHILKDVSLEISEGQSVGLIGRNGAGKTTTVRSIMGMTPPRTGTIEFEGVSLENLRPFQIAQRGIIMIPEERRVFPSMSVEENIRVVSREASQYTIDDIFEIFPNLEDAAKRDAKMLSGGEQQMLAIARALAAGPKLLILDEPFEGLAPNIVDDTRDIIDNIIAEGTTVLISHPNLNIVEGLIERLYVMKNGEVKWQGEISEILARKDLQEQLLGIDTAGI